VGAGHLTVLAVAAGGAVGVLARYGLGTAVSTGRLPWMTVAINVAGSFMLGFLLPLGEDWSAPVRNGLSVGLLGGFTTFSTFSVEVFYDAHGGDSGFALLYLAASVIGGIAAAGLGYYAGRAVAA
jgi:CrcB protein